MEHIGCYLKDIYFNKKSGRLIFRHQNIQKYLFFQDGSLIFAKTNQRQELIGEVLFRLGKISEEVYSKIDEFIEPKQKIGEILIKKDLISQKELYDGLAYQMREITLNIFPFFEGEISFQGIKGFFEHVLEAKIDVPVLIEDGIRRMKFNPSLIEFLKKKVPFPKGKEFYYRLTEEERDVLGTVNGTSSAEGLLRASSMIPEIFWKSLYLLYCLDLIDFEGEEKAFVEEREVKKVATEEMEKNIDEVVTLSEDIASKSFYKILDVSLDASQTEIKKSYFKMARKYHPDLFSGELSPDVKGRVGQVFAYITKAYETLSDEGKRQNYDSKMATHSQEDRKNLAKIAEMKFRQGKTLYDKEMYDDALILLGEAVSLIKEKGRYFLLLALTELKIPSLHKKAEQDFLKSLKLEAWNPEAYVGLGLLYKQEGLLVKAEKLFKKALHLDPEHTVALREMEAFEKREKKKGLKEILSFELFGKKKK